MKKLIIESVIYTNSGFRVINPLDNLDENKLSEMEKLTNNYYDLVSKSSVSYNENLHRFHDLDLENQESLDIDLTTLLKIS
jgi:hypothetical protein